MMATNGGSTTLASSTIFSPQRNQRLLQLPCIGLHLLHGRLCLAEQIFRRSGNAVISLSHRSQGSNKFQVPVLSHSTKGFRRHIQGLLLVGAVCDILHNGIDHLLLGGLPVLPCQEQGLGLLGIQVNGIPDGPVRQTDSHLIDGVIDLVQIVCPTLQAVLQKLEILGSRIPCLLKFSGILGQVIPQFIGLIQAILGTPDNIIHGLLGGQAILLHQSFDAPEGLIHVNPVQFFQRQRLPGKVRKVSIGKFSQVLLDHDNCFRHRVHALAYAGAVHVFHDFSAGFRRLPGLPEVGVYFRNGRLCLRISGYRLISHILDLIPHHR